jgi:hypothetical protein
MPIDPSIPLGVQRARMPDPMQQLSNVLAIKAAQQQGAAADYSMQRQMREDERATATRNALAESGGDYGKVRDVLIGSGDVAGALTLDKGLAAKTKSDNEAKLAELRIHGQKIEIGAQLLGGVRDQATYDSALTRAAQILGPDAIRGAPAQFDPTWVANMRMQALKAKDAIAAQLSERQFTETQRHNKASEATANLRAQNSGPLAMTIGPDGTQTIIGGPNGINPNAMGAMANARGGIKRSEAEGQTLGDYYGGRYVEILKSSDTAQLEDAKLDRLDQLLSQVETGKFKGTTSEIKKAAKAAGVDLTALGIADDVAPVEAARALSGELALTAVQAAMLTPVSNTDLAYITSLQPGIENTPEGRKLIVQTRKAMNKRAREVAKIAIKYRKEKGHLDEDFDALMTDYAEQNPLFHAVTNDEDFAQIPSGQFFAAPDGTVRRKP